MFYCFICSHEGLAGAPQLSVARFFSVAMPSLLMRSLPLSSDEAPSGSLGQSAGTLEQLVENLLLYGDFLKWGGTNLSYRFPIFETSATALCGTTGKLSFFGHLHLGTPPYLLIRF